MSTIIDLHLKLGTLFFSELFMRLMPAPAERCNAWVKQARGPE